MPPAVAAAPSGRDTSSSNGKVFAKASKEWTIPPRPRPGRKAAEPAAAAPKAAKGAQNRDAQRAFRERKQDYVAELEAKIKEYENQEIQKAITLQNISIALKSDNTSLRNENERLRNLVLQLGGDPTLSPEDNYSDASGSTTTSRRTKKKRTRDAASVNGTPPGTTSSRNGSRSGSAEPFSRPGQLPPASHPVAIPSAGSPSTTFAGSFGSSPSSPSYRSIQDLLNMPSSSTASGSISSSVALNNASGPLSPPVWTPYQTPYQIQPPPFAYHRTSPSILSGPGFDVSTLPSAATLKPSSTRTTAEDVDVDCGFCTESDTCVCRMIKEDANLGGASTVREPVAPSQSNVLNVTGIDRPSSGLVSSASAESSSVALLRRRPRKTTSQSLWAVVAPPALPECTGDPSNCPACADDPFGKAFCEELGTEPPESSEVAEHQQQQIKREQQEDVTMTVSCCGAPDACGSHVHACSPSGSDSDGAKHLVLGVEHHHGPSDGKKIPVADAWRQFKSHPNASFADLSLLAEVVSGRHPVPSSPTAAGSPMSSPVLSNASLQSSMPPPAKRRRLELDAEHVQEALRMLDARSASAAGSEGVRETAVRRSHLTRRLSDLRGTLEGMQYEIGGLAKGAVGLGL